jgi:protein-tyrosine phosphatase
MLTGGKARISVQNIFWISNAWEFGLAIMPRPRGGDWLLDEVRDWQEAGINIVVSCLEPHETEELDLLGEAAACARLGIEFITLPLPDVQVPPSEERVIEMVRRLNQDLSAGRRVAIHCRMGIGRSSVVAACVLMSRGLASNEAFELISRARGLTVPDTQAQKDWAEHLSHRFRPSGDLQ